MRRRQRYDRRRKKGKEGKSASLTPPSWHDLLYVAYNDTAGTGKYRWNLRQRFDRCGSGSRPSAFTRSARGGWWILNSWWRAQMGVPYRRPYLIKDLMMFRILTLRKKKRGEILFNLFREKRILPSINFPEILPIDFLDSRFQVKKASRMAEWVKKQNKLPHLVPNEMTKSRWLSVSWSPKSIPFWWSLVCWGANFIDWYWVPWSDENQKTWPHDLMTSIRLPRINWCI